MVQRLLKPLFWVSSSKRDLMKFPDEVKREVGYALHLAQEGKTYFHTTPMKGFGGRGVLEIIANEDGNTYRVIYTVKFEKAVYVLHAFQKKSHKGISTPQHEIELIKQRLKEACEDYNQWSNN